MEFSRDAKIEINSLVSDIIDLHETAFKDGQKDIVDKLRILVQQKDSESDTVAAEVLVWAIKKLTRHVSD